MSTAIPRGIEVLVGKASVDPEFRALLLGRRAAAAEQIGLPLDAAEAMMLGAVPAAQLEAIIERTSVPQEHRRAFLGQAAAAMLAAIGAMGSGMAMATERMMPAPGGIAPGPPPPPPPPTRGIQPDRPPATFGIQPDRPPQPPADAQSIEQKVIEIAAKQFKVEKQSITRETSLVKDLKANGTQLAVFRKELEKEFKINLNYQAARKMQTIAQTVEQVQQALKAKPQPGPQPAPRPQPFPNPGPVGGARPDRPPFSGAGGGARPN